MTLNKNSLGKLPTEAQEQTTLFQWAGMMTGKWPELRLMKGV
jgi:hypothetical protein